MQKKALALLSGGLDSTLAVKVMLEQGIQVEALNFTSPFCTCTGKNAGCKSEAVRVAAEFNIPIKVMHKGTEYLEIVRKPRHGYGKGMNPCVDCRIFLLRKAREYMEESGADFVITIGQDTGSRMRWKIVQKPAPSTRAAFMRSLGTLCTRQKTYRIHND